MTKQAVVTGAAGARDFSVVAKNGFTHGMHNLKSGIQIGAGYTKEIAVDTGSFLIEQAKNGAGLAQQAVATGVGAVKNSCVLTKNCLGKLHTKWTPTIKAALSRTKKIAANTGSFLVAQGKNMAALAHQAASTIGEVSEYLIRSEKPVEERPAESIESFAKAKDVIAATSSSVIPQKHDGASLVEVFTADSNKVNDSSVVVVENQVDNSLIESASKPPFSQQLELESDVTNRVQSVSQSIPIVQQGASSLAYHPVPQPYSANQPMQMAMVPQQQPSMALQTPMVLAMQASAMAMQAQASALMMQQPQQPAAPFMQPVVSYFQPVGKRYAAPVVLSEPTNMSVSSAAKKQDTLNRLMADLQSIARAGEFGIQRLLWLMDLESEIMEQLLADGNGYDIEKAVQERNIAIRQSTPNVAEAYSMILELATSSDEHADPILYNYVVRKGRRNGPPIAQSKSRKTFLTNTMTALEHYYVMIQNMQQAFHSLKR